MIKQVLFAAFLAVNFFTVSCEKKSISSAQTIDDGTRFLVSDKDLAAGTHHTRHAEIFGRTLSGYNLSILRGIDKVQATADSGGGYFAGINAVPAESPVGYPLQLLGKPLLSPPRKTSYCSGSSYAAFMEGMDIILKDRQRDLDSVHYEALRMQEVDGGRREDHVKFWGWWNADGFGNDFALIQYAKIGHRIKPVQSRPGDFMNISWKNGGGHSVIFLGWYLSPDSVKNVVYWSSQKSTNGFGDAIVPISRIKEVLVVRLTNPEHLFRFDIQNQPNSNVSGDTITWQP